MKLVRETLFEKFEEDSDPIKDMGIGMEALLKKREFDSIKEFGEWLAIVIPHILGGIPNDMVPPAGSYINDKYYYLIIGYFDNRDNNFKVGDITMQVDITMRVWQNLSEFSWVKLFKEHYYGDEDYRP